MTKDDPMTTQTLTAPDTKVGEVRRTEHGSTATCICGWQCTTPKTADAAMELWRHRTAHGD